MTIRRAIVEVDVLAVVAAPAAVTDGDAFDPRTSGAVLQAGLTRARAPTRPRPCEFCIDRRVNPPHKKPDP